VTAAQMDALRRIASGRVAVFDLTSHRRLRGAETWTMGIEAPVRRQRGGPRVLNRPLASFPLLPAGTYLLTARHHGAGDGLLMVGVGNDQFAIAVQPVSVFEAGLRVHLPAGARALAIRGDEKARDQLDGMELRPVALDPAPAAPDIARRAVRYGGTVVFFLDDRAFPEPGGFWVGGERDTQVVIGPDDGRGSVSLILRNAPMPNTATLEFGGRREETMLNPGEERLVVLPSGSLIRIRSSAGFRPSELDPKSRDTRFLGVYIRTLEP
jgi:hypothetical protein